jgi:subtilisin family serine protease
VTGAGGFGSPFFGTSAAAPHAAGVAALLLECQPGLSRQELRDFVITTAFDLGNFGPDNSSGYGRIDALDAANAANCAHYTPTPTSPPGTPTPVATPSPTPSEPCIAGGGDVNASGAVNSIDAALSLQYVAGLLADLPCSQGTDVNESGTITSIDAALILQFVAGLLTSLPV